MQVRDCEERAGRRIHYHDPANVYALVCYVPPDHTPPGRPRQSKASTRETSMTPTETWRAIQLRVGVTADGIPGPNTAFAIASALGIELAPPVVAFFDERTERNIATLIPRAQDAARRFMAAAAEAMRPYGVIAKIISGTRTYAEQNALFAKGRTEPGPRVTNARGGYSNHNFGVAFDVGLFRGADYLEDSPLYAALGPVGERLGLEWGGRWTSFVDEPHYQIKTGLTMAEMRERVANGQPIV